MRYANILRPDSNINSGPVFGGRSGRTPGGRVSNPTFLPKRGYVFLEHSLLIIGVYLNINVFPGKKSTLSSSKFPFIEK